MKFNWRPVAGDDSRWLPWVRDLGGKSGVYLVRDKQTLELLHLGSSLNGRVRELLQRHFQAEHSNAGPSSSRKKFRGARFERSAVEVAIVWFVGTGGNGWRLQDAAF